MKDYKDINHRIFLLKAYLEGELSAREQAELESWLSKSARNRELLKRVKNKEIWAANLKFYRQAALERDWQQICKQTLHAAGRQLWMRLFRYAAVFAGLSLSTWAVYRLSTDLPLQTEKKMVRIDTIQPGYRQAYIELVSGEKIVLGDTTGRLVTNIKGMILKENQDGLILQTDDSLQESFSKTAYNKIIVPRGGEYQLTLADGTKVWMNSDSWLEFPVAFTGGERKVRLGGEAYFQVKRNEKQPFRVEVNEIEVAVLGTSFNIQAYEEASYTTLIEGAVEVKIAGSFYKLIPGCAASVKQGKIVIGKTNVYEQIAWKEGKFVFKEKRLEEVMSILGRWYDIGIVYQNMKVKDLHFTGNIPRHATIHEVLKFLERTRLIRFQVTGRVVVVSDY